MIILQDSKANNPFEKKTTVDGKAFKEVTNLII
jgi:hypothetical protein